jgi:hypothetical protein
MLSLRVNLFSPCDMVNSILSHAGIILYSDTSIIFLGWVLKLIPIISCSISDITAVYGLVDSYLNLDSTYYTLGSFKM